jgi:hypothetical protein
VQACPPPAWRPVVTRAVCPRGRPPRGERGGQDPCCRKSPATAACLDKHAVDESPACAGAVLFDLDQHPRFRWAGFEMGEWTRLEVGALLPAWQAWRYGARVSFLNTEQV